MPSSHIRFADYPNGQFRYRVDGTTEWTVLQNEDGQWIPAPMRDFTLEGVPGEELIEVQHWRSGAWLPEEPMVAITVPEPAPWLSLLVGLWFLWVLGAERRKRHDD